MRAFMMMRPKQFSLLEVVDLSLAVTAQRTSGHLLRSI